MKYKIIPSDIVKNMIEFLDEIQFEAAKGNNPDDMQKINFCNWMIGELMNGLDGFDAEDIIDDEKNERWKVINKYRKDLKDDFPDDMTEEEFEKLISQFDSFVKGWDKEYKKSNIKKVDETESLQSFARQLRIDPDLTPEEKFDLYYDEHKKRNGNDSKTLNMVLKELGIKKAPKNNKKD